MKSKENSQKPRGIFLLPNLFTTAALFAAFYSIVAAMKGAFDVAAIAIFIAMVADSLDGRIARLTKTQSDFGAEYDSLSDMVAFGVAPALIVYKWSLHSLGKTGWLIAFIYTATTALRLARFNTKLGDTTNKRYFQGIPSPAAAAVIASLVWMGYDNMVDGEVVRIFIALMTLITGGLMVSSIPYHSFKEIDLKGRVPFMVGAIVVLIYVAISIDPPLIIFLISFGYVLSGIVLALWNLYQARR
ncbi:MAG: CDP-diacylglycerol--serine O-phosphatidyltransferase, partial [Proteobacteria bacterium]|nr:CDP-diacylglycerol--serine O-phosphatidyltransferase [Pseudomonadota bacterium]